MVKSKSTQNRKIKGYVCNNCDVMHKDLFRGKKAKKHANLVRARQILVSILWNEYGYTNYKIRDLIGYKNHSSVIHARITHEKDNQNNITYRRLYGRILLELGKKSDYSTDIEDKLKETKKLLSTYKKLYNTERQECEKIKEQLTDLKKKYLLN